MKSTETVSDDRSKQSTVQACPNCGMKRNEWEHAAGYTEDGTTYCCRGCATGVGCTCS